MFHASEQLLPQQKNTGDRVRDTSALDFDRNFIDDPDFFLGLPESPLANLMMREIKDVAIEVTSCFKPTPASESEWETKPTGIVSLPADSVPRQGIESRQFSSDYFHNQLKALN